MPARKALVAPHATLHLHGLRNTLGQAALPCTTPKPAGDTGEAHSRGRAFMPRLFRRKGDSIFCQSMPSAGKPENDLFFS